jgi:hypothetical protein
MEQYFRLLNSSDNLSIGESAISNPCRTQTEELWLWGTTEETLLSRGRRNSVRWDLGFSEKAVQGPIFGFRVRKSWVQVRWVLL